MAEATKPMNIYQAISKCMKEIGAVKKNSVNKTQGFNYRGIEAVVNAINPVLVKNHVFLVPKVLEHKREERKTAKGGLLIYSICKIEFTFYAEDGSNITAVTIGEGMDSGDKATNKAMAIAFKYACFQVFCIPTEEMAEPAKMDDPDAESYTPEPKQPEPASVEQLHRMDELVIAFAEACENRLPTDVWNELKKRYQFSETGDISADLAEKIIKQVEAWYNKKKGG